MIAAYEYLEQSGWLAEHAERSFAATASSSTSAPRQLPVSAISWTSATSDAAGSTGSCSPWRRKRSISGSSASAASMRGFVPRA